MTRAPIALLALLSACATPETTADYIARLCVMDGGTPQYVSMPWRLLDVECTK